MLQRGTMNKVDIERLIEWIESTNQGTECQGTTFAILRARSGQKSRLLEDIWIRRRGQIKLPKTERYGGYPGRPKKTAAVDARRLGVLKFDGNTPVKPYSIEASTGIWWRKLPRCFAAKHRPEFVVTGGLPRSFLLCTLVPFLRTPCCTRFSK
jgi:hypothetical protein